MKGRQEKDGSWISGGSSALRMSGLGCPKCQVLVPPRIKIFQVVEGSGVGIDRGSGVTTRSGGEHQISKGNQSYCISFHKI